MRYFALLMAGTILSACATAPVDNNVVVETFSGGQPLPGANCIVSTGAGSWSVLTPATVAAGSTSGDLHVQCNKSGYRTSEVLYRPTASSYSGSNVGIGIGGGSGGRGGSVGVGFGIGFPIAIGGGRYPSLVTVDMHPQ